MLAVIGGTGLSDLESFKHISEEGIKTIYAETEVQVRRLVFEGCEFLFIPRHGHSHSIPPHLINYRANISALAQLDVKNIVAVNAVGGIHGNLGPGSFAIPNQIIDYSHGREGTYSVGGGEDVNHIDFTYPYDENLRQILLTAANQANKKSKTQHQIMDGGVYACTQGPRLETAAEITRLERDGCDMVGMTGMPEAALARELGIAYGSLALSVNWAAGLSEELITMTEIQLVLEEGMGFVSQLLENVITSIGNK
ncbi:MAG: S-methyl-5'-thioinosine phosphorylase [Gammaproteobacteria bacterium]|jgi:5'-methylthioinosine phosphorylase|nr:S-methyl-5'-thioinosine phosphorylase [Gammaproteobacteria bacterium]MBT3858695.1 S-methyl-5'-thioinosine phosphorylase [Gammaproteobacteria bacterium]MBT3986047.1 S-methyl-5'-thioinosine phosphorylase [Gammaproteobacteria bacterium]MBT4580758.1 S-methyl-5'-thioinosine phosphorylase [Gammaproteobacteria bacterium]MBT4658971.1 S-methyl-5'-thioinosine phosphorylase [Gammaproteobacteria bacterium]